MLMQWDMKSNSSEYSDEENEGRRAMHFWWSRLTQAEKESANPSSGFPTVLDGYCSDTESETQSNISGDEHGITSPRGKDRDDMAGGGANFLACCIRR